METFLKIPTKTVNNFYTMLKMVSCADVWLLAFHNLKLLFEYLTLTKKKYINYSEVKILKYKMSMVEKCFHQFLINDAIVN